jgi:hypothetical protein
LGLSGPVILIFSIDRSRTGPDFSTSGSGFRHIVGE